MTDQTPTLRPDHSLADVAAALGMSPRWVRDRIRKDGAPHQRYGHVIRFTDEQVDALKAAHVKAPASQSITTGRKRKAS